MKLPGTLPKIAGCFIVGVAVASTSKILNGDYAFFNSLWPALPAICLATYYLIDFQALMHASKIDRGVYPTHWQAWLLRAGVTLLIASLFHAYHFMPVKVVDLSFFAAGWIGIVFNYRLNMYRGLPAFYVGMPDKKKDGLQEKIFREWKYGGQLLFALEVAWMIVWGYVYLQ